MAVNFPTSSEAQPHAPTPEIAGRATGQAARPQIMPEDGYYLAWHPMAWHVMAGLVVPRLKKISLTPGADGCDVNRAGKPEPSLAVAQAQQNGWTVIPYDVDGPGTAYIKPDGVGGWISKWQRVYPGSTLAPCDEPAYARWCKDLVENGHISPPEDFVLAQLEDEHVGWMRVYLKDKNDGRAEHIRDLVDVIRKERAAMQSGAVPLPDEAGLPEIAKPKTRKPRKPKAEPVVEEPSE